MPLPLRDKHELAQQQHEPNGWYREVEEGGSLSKEKKSYKAVCHEVSKRERLEIG